jgi:molybdopterin molybdotransferase
MPAKLTPVDEALAFLLEQIPRFQSRQWTECMQTVPLSEALGCILAENQLAHMAVPADDNSAMDGYAVRHRDCERDDCLLPLSQTIAAGHPGQPLLANTAARIFTGAPIPAGADAVVMQENTERAGNSVRVLQAPKPGENIRKAGHDIALGSEILRAGHRLQPQDLGLLASLGIVEVKVLRPLTVAIINTGDEVVAQGQPLRPGQLYDSNSFTLAGLLQALGMKVKKFGIVADNLADTEAALARAAAEADCIITTGGVSVGEADYVKQAVDKQGVLSLWKLAIKPGKPFSFGHVGAKPFFGLPGNPVAVFVTFVALVRPFLLKMQGATRVVEPVQKVRAGFSVNEAGSRQEYLRVRLLAGDDGWPTARLFPDQSSSVLTSLSWADGLAIVPIGSVVQPGQWLEYLSFRGTL